MSLFHKIKSLAPLLAILVLMTSAACSKTPSDTSKLSSTTGEPTKTVTTITDLAGRSVALNMPVARVVALAGPSYEKVFLLGQQDRLVGAHYSMVTRSWVVKTNPNIASVVGIQNPSDPNVEDLLAMGVDCLFFWDYDMPLANLTGAGIPVVVVQQATGNPTTLADFIAYQKREVQAFADALGPEAQAKARDWYSYFDERVQYVTERTAGIAEADRKTALYFSRADTGLLFSLHSYPSFWLEMAGGKNLAEETGVEMNATVTMEQIMVWDPDFIFTGRMTSTDPILNNEKWASLSAVINGHVYICPEGVMYWDYSSEGILLMQFLAQKMYPELFSDLDMVAETQRYYKRFYGFDLTADDAQRLLSHLAPA